MNPEERFERIEQSLERSEREREETRRAVEERYARMEKEREESRRASDERMAQVQENIRLLTQIALRTDARLDRAIHLAVREARAERRKSREVDVRWNERLREVDVRCNERLWEVDVRWNERLDRLAATVQAFIDSMKQGGNGHGHGPQGLGV